MTEKEKQLWYTGYFDGSCRPNPGVMGIGVILYSPNGRVLNQASYGGEHGTNNIAEYIALSRILKMAYHAGAKRLRVYGDSELILRQAAGVWKCHYPLLRTILQTVQSRAKQIDHVEYISIRREENAVADALSTDWRINGSVMPSYPRLLLNASETPCSINVILPERETVVKPHTRRVTPERTKSSKASQVIASAAWTGKKHSEVTKAKLREAQRARRERERMEKVK